MTPLRISLAVALAGIAYGWLWVNNLPLLREYVVAIAAGVVLTRFVLWPLAKAMDAWAEALDLDDWTARQIVEAGRR